MAPFRSGNNEDYVTHIIAMRCLLEQKETEEGVAKAFKVVEELKGNKLGPLAKRLNMSKLNVNKEDLKLQITSVKEDMQKARKEALADIVKAYKLMCVYFVGKVRTQWDKIAQEMHSKDPWVGVNGTSHKGPCMVGAALENSLRKKYFLTHFFLTANL
jgi:hypothetical protein